MWNVHVKEMSVLYSDPTEVSLLFANQTEDDILVRDKVSILTVHRGLQHCDIEGATGCVAVYA